MCFTNLFTSLYLDLMDTFLQSTSGPRCPSCHHSQTTSEANSSVFVCTQCHTVFQLNGSTIPIVFNKNYAQHSAALQLGDTFFYNDTDYRITGKVVKCEAANNTAIWTEYFLTFPNKPNIYLSESFGHWNVLEIAEFPLPNWNLRIAQNAIFDYPDYNYTVKIVYAEGCFNLNPFAEDGNLAFEYVKEPNINIVEHNPTTLKNEFYTGRYIFPSELKSRLKESRTLPEQQGYGSSQPFYTDLNIPNFFALSFVSIVFFFLVQLVFNFIVYPATNRETLKTVLETSPTDSTKVTLIRNIQVPYDHAIMNIELEASGLNNDWVSSEMTLVNEETGEEWFFVVEAEKYSGVDGGESWSEGSNTQQGVVNNLIKGTYHLEIAPYQQPGTVGKTITLYFSFYKGSWTIFGLFAGLLLLVIISVAILENYFLSDKRKSGSDDDDDDDE